LETHAPPSLTASIRDSFIEAKLGSIGVCTLSSQLKIYWANALFSDADRAFNKRCAKKLRSVGYEVFLPQETPFTFDEAPTNEEIYEADSEAILTSDVLVACIDQFPIDAGVACEIGVASNAQIPIIALYTDIRAKRKGPGKMYKNQYVLGAIEKHGMIVHSVDNLLSTLREIQSSLTSK